jgi:HAD superfamily phosphoserine phosphatase-like hydrolase
MIISSPWLLSYATGIITNHQAKNRLLVHFLGGRSLQNVQALSQSFVKNKLPSLIRPKAIEALNHHQKNNDTCILISASPNIYLDIWGRKKNFDHIITTRIVKDVSTYIGCIGGKNCYGEEKVNRLKEKIGDLSNFYIISYGDSRGDKELFDISDEVNYKPFRN